MGGKKVEVERLKRKLVAVIQVRDDYGFGQDMGSGGRRFNSTLFFNLIFIVLFPLPFIPLVPLCPQQSPHCCLCL